MVLVSFISDDSVSISDFWTTTSDWIEDCDLTLFFYCGEREGFLWLDDSAEELNYIGMIDF